MRDKDELRQYLTETARNPAPVIDQAIDQRRNRLNAYVGKRQRQTLRRCTIFSGCIRTVYVSKQASTTMFTKRLFRLSNMSYRDRLKMLSLPTLEDTRFTADLIFCYKIINGLVRLDPADFFVFHDSKTRGHSSLAVMYFR